MRHTFYKVFSTDEDSESFCEKDPYYFKDKEKALDLAKTLLYRTIPCIPNQMPFLSLIKNPRSLRVKCNLAVVEVDEGDPYTTLTAIYDAEFYEIQNGKMSDVQMCLGKESFDIIEQNATIRCLGSLYLEDEYSEDTQYSFQPRYGFTKWYARRTITIEKEEIYTED